MFTQSPHTCRTVGKTFRWIVLLPVLMVGSLLYWSVAIGLGGLSLMAASALSVSTNSAVGITRMSETEAPATLDLGDGMTPIMVHLEESVEPEDVNDNAGAAGFAQPADDTQMTVTPGPGATSF
jgi:hypothetical protein